MKITSIVKMFLAGCAFALTAGSANAALLSVTPGGKIISNPASVADDAAKSNRHMLGFDEKQNVVLTSDLAIDGGMFIAAGTHVSSHMILLNTKGNKRRTRVADWTFDGIVLGVMSDRNGLLEAASNTLLGAVGTFYPGSFNNRGFENSNVDFYQAQGLNTLRVGMRVTEPGDWIRVVTLVPAPETIGLVLVGLAGLYGARRRRKT